MLTCDDINFEDRTITISQKSFMGTSKTINSERKVYICDTLLIALKIIKRNKIVLKRSMVINIIFII